MRAVVVALGKIGLPIATRLAVAGHDVTGCDVDPSVVSSVNRGEPAFPGEAGLEEALARVVSSGRLRATTETSSAVARGAELVIAVPPLIVDGNARPEFRILDAVVEDIGAGLRPQTVVSIETTVPVGTTRNRISPRLAEISGLSAERDFFTVHSPERVYSGRVFSDLDSYPKLVGGLSEAGEERAVRLYQSFLEAEVRAMGSAEAAELTKLAETTYRDVNIALANEFAMFADEVGVDIRRVIDAANSQPFSHIHRPGVAVGGHCIPVYPRFYLAGHPDARLPAAARQVNEAMPAYAVELLARHLLTPIPGSRVVILGIAYRGGVKEVAFSGAFALQAELSRRGATVLAADPLFDDDELRTLGFEPWNGGGVDAAIIQADHEVYASLQPRDLPGAKIVIDGRDVLDTGPWDAAEVPVRRIGRSDLGRRPTQSGP